MWILSNCKSLSLLRHTGYPWVTWSLIAPAALPVKRIVPIWEGEEVVGGFEKKSWCDFQPATSSPQLCSISGCCMWGWCAGLLVQVPSGVFSCQLRLNHDRWVLVWEVVRSLQDHLLYLWLLHLTPPTSAVRAGHHSLPVWLRWQTPPCRSDL